MSEKPNDGDVTTEEERQANHVLRRFYAALVERMPAGEVRKMVNDAASTFREPSLSPEDERKCVQLECGVRSGDIIETREQHIRRLQERIATLERFVKCHVGLLTSVATLGSRAKIVAERAEELQAELMRIQDEVKP